jgi:hypothetical protein
MSEDFCPKCNQRWEHHEFGVPAPFCPITTDASQVPDRRFDTSQPLVKNAQECRLCGGMMHRYHDRFECANNPAHRADLFTGLTTDHGKDKTRRYPFIWIGCLGFYIRRPWKFTGSTVSPWGPGNLRFHRMVGPVYWAPYLPEKLCGIRMV